MTSRSAAARRLCLAGALALTAGGCALTFDARTLGVNATLAGPAAQPAVGDSFRVTTRATHLLWGLYASRTPNVRNLLAGQLGEGAAIANLRIRARKRPADLLVTALTLGLYSPTSVTLEGVITRTAPPPTPPAAPPP